MLALFGARASQIPRFQPLTRRAYRDTNGLQTVSHAYCAHLRCVSTTFIPQTLNPQQLTRNPQGSRRQLSYLLSSFIGFKRYESYRLDSVRSFESLQPFYCFSSWITLCQLCGVPAAYARYASRYSYCTPYIKTLYIETLTSGSLIAGGQDSLINVFPISQTQSEPTHTLVGHSENVCAIDTTSSGTIISGSWDKCVFHLALGLVARY